VAYRIELTKSAIKELERLPARFHDKVVERLTQLQQDPRVFGAEKLTGIDAYKLRVGRPDRLRDERREKRGPGSHGRRSKTSLPTSSQEKVTRELR
jgi:hypothetical protein